MRRMLWIAALSAACGLPAPAARAQLLVSPPRATRTELDSLRALYRVRPRDETLAITYARALAVQNSIPNRRRASRILQSALREHPRSADLHLALADLYYRQGYLSLSRRELKAAIAAEPGAAPAYARLGRLAFRDWLKFQRSEALQVARHYWRESASRDPDDTESWLGLGILDLLANEAQAAERDARRCLDAAGKGLPRPSGRSGLYLTGASGTTPDRAVAAPDPRGEGWLLLGAASYLEGNLERADSAFSAALPFLSPAARAHLLDITNAADDRDTTALGTLRLDSGKQAEYLRRFWRSRDPDLVTSINELRLQYLMRGAVAYFLFFDPRKQRWDERGTILTRYGMPEEMQYNPPELAFGPISTNRLVWRYPSLGMDVVLEDRYLNEAYDLPILMYRDADPIPDTAKVSAALRNGDIALAGRGIFLSTKRGETRLGGEAQAAVFRRVKTFDPRAGVARGPEVGRVELYLGVTGRASTAGVSADAVVLDSTWREVARARGVHPAWCGSDTVQVFQLNFDLPEGDYTVGLSAGDAGRRAYRSWRLPVRVVPPLAGRVEISDIELSCQYDPDPAGGPFDKTSFRVLPNPLRDQPRGSPLGVYFEIYGLTPDESGRSQVSVEYTVRSLTPDRRPFFVQWFDPRRNQPRIQVVREDEVPGRVRFQYVSADLSELSAGPYRLEVKVEDKNSGLVAVKRADFRVTP